MSDTVSDEEAACEAFWTEVTEDAATWPGPIEHGDTDVLVKYAADWRGGIFVLASIRRARSLAKYKRISRWAHIPKFDAALAAVRAVIGEKA